ncbi:ubinuclein-2b [Garra rufa]|uniref:ubinuclein-2b n=1 Tax=Garra rufa TaxID=137080 RepID=UPI003CCEB26F
MATNPEIADPPSSFNVCLIFSFQADCEAERGGDEASRQFDMEGRKKFFTLDMNNILLDIELQVQEQPATVRSAVYCHLEAFVPCNKEALLKRLKKLSLNIQDDRLRTPLHKLKLAVCSVMPEQIARYNMDCMAKVAKQHTEDGDRNGSEDDDDEKPGKRVMGPRKKFMWDDKLRSLLCNLVQVKLGCYELEGQSSLSAEDYLKVFMETEVKPLWPKGWMQARMLFKESRMAHSHLTGNTVKKRVIPTPKAKPKPQDSGALQRPSISVDSTPPSTVQRQAVSVDAAPQASVQRTLSPPEPICLSDSLDEDLTAPSLDSISHALAMLSSAAKDLVQSDSPPTVEVAKPPQSLHASPHLAKKSTSTPPPPAPPPSILSSSASPVVKGVSVLSSVQRHSVIPAQRPAVTPPTKMGVSQAKPRPPPTASPLHAPQKILAGKTVVAMPTGLIKTSNNSSSPVHSRTLPAASSPALLNVKSAQSFHVTPQVKNHESPKPGFITPMQATLTKSPHNPSSPIIKLTPTASPVVTRPPTIPSMHQHASKSPAFHTGFVAGGYVGQKNSSQGNNISGLATTTASVAKQTATSVSPVAGTANHTQRHRQVGGASQGVKTITSVSSATASPLSQVSSSSAALLGSAGPSLPLGYGMLGGLVPVSLPFQFPNLLNLPSSVVSTATTGVSTNPSSSGFNLPQNVLKGLMSGAQGLPPHLQLAFSDVNQTQGGDLKRKTL